MVIWGKDKRIDEKYRGKATPRKHITMFLFQKELNRNNGVSKYKNALIDRLLL